MIPAALQYRRASSVDDALAVLAEHGDEAKLLAGGHSLLPLMKLRLAAPEIVVDIAGLRELSYVRDEDDHIAIGAMTRYHDLVSDPLLERHVPLVAHVAGTIGDPQVRHRGTIGGSVAHGDAAADLPAALLACDAEFVVRTRTGQRTIAAEEFFLGPFTTALGPDEVLTEIRVPKRTGVGWGFEKFTRRSIDWAIVGVAVCGQAVALINMAGTPMRAEATERALADGASIGEAARLAAEGTSPADEPHATSEYRRHLARVLTERALLQADQRG
ncbi:xanthine dehydrogenase family protein subunit M [Saccharomonospora sp.]|uniref:FAD binding domain-containing protein n=1 Tax=Saccharomonospora sp. TaxID=33913 RepID=UPI002604DD02|nr:xanthine dehydrogenase family protein subunit M [Saccharomonospora sp.]